MDKYQQEYKEFLEQQLQWCKEQDRLLEEIESKLHEMRRIAEYALEHEFTSIEKDRLNGRLHELKKDIHSLEMKLQTVVH